MSDLPLGAAPTPANERLLGEKVAYATAALAIGIACYVNLFQLEKALLAVIFGWLALRGRGPRLESRRGFAWIGLILGAVALIAIPILLYFFWDRMHELADPPRG